MFKTLFCVFLIDHCQAHMELAQFNCPHNFTLTLSLQLMFSVLYSRGRC